MKSKRCLTNKILIFSVAVFAAALCLALFWFNASKIRGERANIYKDGKIIQTLDLNTPKEIDLGTNIILVKDGTICVKSATCPDKLCVKQGEISFGGESVICLPNKVVIEVTGKSQDVDAVSR